MAGLVVQVVVSSHEVDDMAQMRPPTGDASAWYMRSRTAVTVIPASPETSNMMKVCFCELASTHSELCVPKLVDGRASSTWASAVGRKLRVPASEAVRAPEAWSGRGEASDPLGA